MKFYFTYGSDGHPFVGGWTEVEASDIHTVCRLFRAVHPDKISGIMNCSCCYSQEQFNATRMGETGNFDQFATSALHTPFAAGQPPERSIYYDS